MLFPRYYNKRIRRFSAHWDSNPLEANEPVKLLESESVRSNPKCAQLAEALYAYTSIAGYHGYDLQSNQEFVGTS